MIGPLITRIGAVFMYSAMAMIGGASIVGGIPVWKAAVLAGISATAQVLEKLARAYADDGKITREELDAAFHVASRPSSQADDAGVDG
jgi:hypothetical protein